MVLDFAAFGAIVLWICSWSALSLVKGKLDVAGALATKLRLDDVSEPEEGAVRPAHDLDVERNNNFAS